MNTLVAPFIHQKHLEKTFMSLSYHHDSIVYNLFLDHVLSIVI
jgi:hypothetical protein